jgi:hypothetical protein
MLLSAPTRYRNTLEKLATEPPSTKTALLRDLLPQIELVLASGKTRKQVWQRLTQEGLDITFETFCRLLSRVRIKRPHITAALGGKNPVLWNKEATQSVAGAAHDPLANLRRVEQSRPGFHFRGTEHLDVLVHGKREPREEGSR